MNRETNVICLQMPIFCKIDPFLIKFSVTKSEIEKQSIMLEINMYRKNELLDQFLINFEP